MHSAFVTGSKPHFLASRRSWTEFSAEGVARNLAWTQAKIGQEGHIMAVVKADAYGHGVERMAAACAGRVHSFGVACLDEAEQLRATGVLEPVYLLGPVLPQERGRVVSGAFRPVISTLEEGSAFEKMAGERGTQLSVLWSLDTGMGRIGTLPAEVPELSTAWAHWSHLHLDSIGSHFPSADEDHAFTERQSQEFHAAVKELQRKGLRPEYVQLNNSAGIMGYDTPPRELVRAGLMLYGVAPFPEMQPELVPVLTWKTSITLVRKLPAQWGVNYGRTFITEEPTWAATLAVGYADGYQRALSNRGAEVLIQGQRCPLLGRVTMDQIVVNVSHLETLPVPGDEVVLLGVQGAEEITAAELATKAGTIPWEIFTAIKAR